MKNVKEKESRSQRTGPFATYSEMPNYNTSTELPEVTYGIKLWLKYIDTDDKAFMTEVKPDSPYKDDMVNITSVNSFVKHMDNQMKTTNPYSLDLSSVLVGSIRSV